LTRQRKPHVFGGGIDSGFSGASVAYQNTNSPVRRRGGIRSQKKTTRAEEVIRNRGGLHEVEQRQQRGRTEPQDPELQEEKIWALMLERKGGTKRTQKREGVAQNQKRASSPLLE